MTKLSPRYKLVAKLQDLSLMMFCQARLSSEDATVRLDFESVAMSVRTKLNGNKNWKQNPENGAGDIRR
jgi:hypothetical protein